jgi:hypothetical protein
MRDRETLEIRWVSPGRGFGLFARRYGSCIDGYRNIKEGEIIGMYTGIVNFYAYENTDYMWNYLTYLIDHDGYSYLGGNDSRQFGNYMRFVNHDLEKLNCRPVYVLFKVYIMLTSRIGGIDLHNVFRYVMYVADTFIERGEEIFTSYGESYFHADRVQSS